MDSVTDLRKIHSLKPCVTSIDDGLVAQLPRPFHQQRFSVSSSELEILSSKISSTGFRVANRDFKSWAEKMEALHEPIWRKAGIFEAIRASTYNIPTNPSLILALVEKWCPETNSFVFPWGEATITLEDVMVILGFSVLGSPVFAPLESSEMRDAVAKLERGRVDNRSKDTRVSQKSWISSFRDRDNDDEIEHEAFLTMWLSDFVFPDAWRRSISGNVLPIAVRLARGEKIALAPAVLASLYRDLSRIHGFVSCSKFDKRIKTESLFKLLQVWIWERFRIIRPEEAREIQMGEPRIARWCFRKKRCEKNDERLSFDDFEWRPYAKSLKNWSLPRFYVEEAKWVSVDDSLDDEFLSFARCLRVSRLVGIGFAEDYYPTRVAMQFGFDQDLPGLVTHLSNFTEKEAWDDYNRSLDGLKLYIPSRLATTSVTTKYKDWWLKSILDFLSDEEEVTETFTERNTGDYDHDDVSPKVLPYSQVVEKLGGGFHAALKRCKKRRKAKNVRSDIEKGRSTSREATLSELFEKELMKRKSVHLRKERCKRGRVNGFDAKLERCRKLRKSKKDIVKGKRGDCGGSTSREVALGELFQEELAKRKSEHLRNKRAREEAEDDDDSSMDCDDDNITIAEMIKSRKLTGRDASKSREEDKSDSGLVQKLASEDETVAIQEIEPRVVEEEDDDDSCSVDCEDDEDNITISEMGKSRKKTKGDASESLEENNKLNSRDETVAILEIEPRIGDEEEETGSKAENIGVLVPSNETNSPDSPLVVVSPQEDESVIDVGTKEEECLIHGNGEKQREKKLCSEVKAEEEEIDERLKQRKLAIEELALKLEARIMKMEKSLAKIRDWKTKRNQTNTTGVSV